MQNTLSFSCSEIVKFVLDDRYATLRAQQLLTEGELDNIIKSKIIDLKHSYYPMNPSYPDDYTCFSYLYKYTISHAVAIWYAMLQSPELAEALGDLEEIRVATIGGGPGTDVLGIVKFLLGQGRNFRLIVDNYDQVEHWEPYWRTMCEKLSSLYEFRVRENFHKLDTMNPSGLRKISSVDIFTLSYVLSEVYTNHGTFVRYLETLIALAKPGAFIVFVDNDTPKYYSLFDQLIDKHRLLALKGDSLNLGVGACGSMGDLEIYNQKFDHCPKWSNNRMAYRVCQKPLIGGAG